MRKFAAGFLFVFSIVAGASAPHRLDEVLARSLFVSETPPDFRLNDAVIAYDPILVSVVASLRSRSPAKVKTWETVSLPALDRTAPCAGPITAFVRKSRTGDPRTFVLLPGSFASASRGSFTNQTAAALDQAFGDPTLMTFAGYMSTEFLKGACFKIPWDGIGIGRDLFARLNVWFKENESVGAKRGLVGYSGGGLLTLAMLAADAAKVKQGSARVFPVGGMVFSPVLHGRKAFAILDSRHRQSTIAKDLTLTTMDYKNVFAISKNLGTPAWWQIPGLYQKNPREFIDRAYNEFTVSDLSATLRAVGASAPRAFESFYEAHVLEGFANENPGPSESIDARYDAATDVGALFNQIDAPLFLYSSQDDPVLGDVPEVLAQAYANSNVKVFNPKFGAHTGSLLDSIFNELIAKFFGE